MRRLRALKLKLAQKKLLLKSKHKKISSAEKVKLQEITKKLNFLIFIFLFSFPELITRVFTTDTLVIQKTPMALRWVFAATPIIAIQLIGAAYFQAVGKAIPALLLTLSRQAFFFIPLIFILPFGVYIGNKYFKKSKEEEFKKIVLQLLILISFIAILKVIIL